MSNFSSHYGHIHEWRCQIRSFASILKRVEEIFREELEQDELVLTDKTTAEDVDGWDSLSHVQLVAAMEEAFGIEFKSREILSWDNIGDLIDCIEKKV